MEQKYLALLTATQQQQHQCGIDSQTTTWVKHFVGEKKRERGRSAPDKTTLSFTLYSRVLCTCDCVRLFVCVCVLVGHVDDIVVFSA